MTPWSNRLEQFCWTKSTSSCKNCSFGRALISYSIGHMVTYWSKPSTSHLSRVTCKRAILRAWCSFMAKIKSFSHLNSWLRSIWSKCSTQIWTWLNWWASSRRYCLRKIGQQLKARPKAPRMKIRWATSRKKESFNLLSWFIASRKATIICGMSARMARKPFTKKTFK